MTLKVNRSSGRSINLCNEAEKIRTYFIKKLDKKYSFINTYLKNVDYKKLD